MKTNFVPLLTRNTAQIVFACVCTAVVAGGVGVKIGLEQACWGYDRMEDYYRQPSVLFTWKPRVQANAQLSPIEKPAQPQLQPTPIPVNPASVLQ